MSTPSSRRRIPFFWVVSGADVLIDLPLLLPKYTDFEFLPCRDLRRRRAYRSSSLVQWSCKSESQHQERRDRLSMDYPTSTLWQVLLLPQPPRGEGGPPRHSKHARLADYRA